MLPLPDSGIRGLKAFDSQLMREANGSSMLISNDVFRLYFGYVSSCRRRGDEPDPFGLWLSTTKQLPHVEDSEVPDESFDITIEGDEPLELAD